MKDFMRSAYWVKNDIRLNDNTALNRFCKESTEGLIFWCTDANFSRWSEFKKQAHSHALHHFKEKLKLRGQNLVIFNKPITQILPQLINELKIQKLFYTEDYAFNEKIEEASVRSIATDKNIQIESFDQGTLLAQKQLPFLIENMPLVFTDFRKKIEPSLFIQKPVLPPVDLPLMISVPDNLDHATTIPNKLNNQNSSEDDMLQRLHHYFWETKSVVSYKETRNGLLNLNDSTRFSIGLNLGTISPRTIFQELKRFEHEIEANDSTYWILFELLWRDYFKFLSLRYGNKIFLREGLESGAKKKYNHSGQDRARFAAWCEGKTENQFINANMNELNATGWMSNRGRQNVASYLIHQLQCPWTWGARYFEKTLIDYDPDLNWGNWLYLSGKGTDPRSRVFNVDRQSSMYDPDSAYQKKWT